jgi:hypothetical protein
MAAMAKEKTFQIDYKGSSPGVNEHQYQQSEQKVRGIHNLL